MSNKTGQLTAIYGCMFSGKTGALIDYLSQSGLKPDEFIVIKPDIDTRYSRTAIVTHDGKSHDALIYHLDFDINEHLTPFTRLVVLDEAQFFNKVFMSDIRRLLSKGIHVLAAGLDLDYLLRPFGLMATIIEAADEKRQLKAQCSVCGNPAEFTFRKNENKVLILLGQSDYYEARCASCHPLADKKSIVNGNH